MFAQGFNIRHKIGGGVVGEIGFGCGATGAALIEQDDALPLGI